MRGSETVHFVNGDKQLGREEGEMKESIMKVMEGLDSMRMGGSGQ